MVLSRETELLRRDAQQQGTLLTVEEREAIIRPYLPKERATAGGTRPKRKPIRSFLKSQLHIFLFLVIHSLFSLYIRIRQTYRATLFRVSAVLHYHHRTPELIRKDVRSLSRLPRHLSVILERKPQEYGEGGLEVLLDQVAEISAWCACAGVPMLSVYERTGALKSYIPTVHRTVASKLHAYFGKGRPSLQVRAPHMPSFLNGDVSEDAPESSDAGHLSLLLLSSEDGRSTLVDLTRTLAEMSQHGKLHPSDISQELIDAEISESVMGEPDLLVLFSPTVRLEGYPPWHLWLTEIFHVHDNTRVEYLVWLAALHKFAKAQMRFGR